MTTRSAKRKKRNHEARISKYVSYTQNLVEDLRLRYHESVRDEVTVQEIVRGRCQSFVTALIKAFPDELTAAKGFFCNDPLAVDDPMPGEEHWWCKTKSGFIFDPTFAQFSCNGYYVEYRPEDHEVYKGKCMNCGAEEYAIASHPYSGVCSTACHEALDEYYSKAVSG